ncbi:hypothetical protein HBI24_201080 [Parastagonospora nodorum]|nr:hypothetical protein HBI24_201080 [Parastagonospora nodorum]
MNLSDRPNSTDEGRSNGVLPEQEEIGGTHRRSYGSLGNPNATGGQQMALDPAYGGPEDYAMTSAQPQPMQLGDSANGFGLHEQLTSAAAGPPQDESSKNPKNAIGNPYAQNQSMVAANQPPQAPPSLSEPYLQSKPDHIYNMPGGTLLQFTLVEVIALLVNWFKVYPDLAERFLNNGLSSATHIVILEEHRNVVMTEKDRNRTKDLISDANRRSMRKISEGWTKAKHKKPEGWNGNTLSVNHLTHEKGVKARPVLMKVLMNDIKHLPQGDDAGDLTRALEYAMSNQKRGPNGEPLEWLFPDDLHTILGHIGYTTITQNHLDGAAVARYDKICKQKEQLDRKRRRESQEAGMPPPASKRRIRGERNAGDNQSGQPVFQPSAQGTLSTLLSTGPTPSGFVFQSGSRMIAPQPSFRDALHASIEPSLQDHNAVRETDARPNAAFAHQANQAAIPTLSMPFASSFGAKQYNSAQEHVERPNAAFAEQVEQAAIPTLSMPFGLPLATKEQVKEHTPDMSNGLNQSAPIASPPNILSVQPQAADDTFLFAQEDVDISITEIDAIIAGNQTYNFSDLLAGPFSDFRPDSIAGIMQQYPKAYPLTQVLGECVEADDLEDEGVVARAARWCRDPDNFASHYTVRDLGFVVTLQNLVEDAKKNGFDGSVEDAVQ